MRTTSYDPDGDCPHDILARELLEELPGLAHMWRRRSVQQHFGPVGPAEWMNESL